MRTIVSLTLLILCLFLSRFAQGDDKNRLADALAVQEAIHRAIERAEPSIACVLVSRSNRYPALLPAQPDIPGKLGRFDLRGARLGMGFNDADPEYQELSRLDLSDPNNVPEAYGSGVVIDEREGLILTTARVIRKATKIYVRLSGGRGSWADIHASDARSDLAVLRLIDRMPNLKALKLGDGSKLRKGDFVLSLSNPFAIGFRDGSPSASWGMVSNLRRRATGENSDVLTYERNAKLPLYCFGTLIETDTRMNLGCSGGALLNLRGELVGLTSALAGIAGGETPGGFAVPLDEGYRRIIDILRRGEEVEYGFLGVYLMGQDEVVPEGYVQITRLVLGGPAARGGIHAGVRGGIVPRGGARDVGGDYILSIDGTPVHNNDDLFLVVGKHLAGTTVRVEVASKPPDEGRRICLVTLAKFPPLEPIIASKRPAAAGGLRVDWTSTRAPERQTIPTGVVIREVVPRSAAETARLQPDMIIHKVNQREVTNPSEFYREMKKANGPVELMIATAQGGEERIMLDSR